MDKRTFDQFRTVVYEKSGIALSDGKEALVHARVGKRMRALGIEDYEVYLGHVLKDESGEELVHLLDAISTNVTSFFREPEHFDFLSQKIGEWKNAGQRRFRIWCAASSTGEEPYSMTLALQDALRDGSVDLKILATDISTRVLAKCMEGIYSDDKLKTVPVELRNRFFSRVPGQDEKVHYAIDESLKKLITFRRLNLSTPPFPMRGPLDIVFCRNVMIYFDNRVRSNLLNEIFRLLKPGGYLMVGHAESLTGMMSTFKCVKPSIYIKPA